METKFTYPKTVFIWSKDKAKIELAKKITKDLNLDLFIANQEEDLYAVPFFFGLIDSELLTKEILKNINSIFLEMDKKNFAILIYPETELKLPARLKGYVLSAPDSLEYENLKLSILNKKQILDFNKRKNGNYETRIQRCFMIMRMLLEPGAYVKIEDLCVYFRVSTKTIQRDFDLFKWVGENVVYDKVKKVYYLEEID
jgi:hypothetical protein